MPLNRESFVNIRDRTWNSFVSKLSPIDKTPRYNILKFLSAVDAGIEHQLLGDIDFYAEQIFPDTASGEYLRAHWSDRVKPLTASYASGYALQTGVSGCAIPIGIVFTSIAGKRYYTKMAYTIGDSGSYLIQLFAEEAGSESNLLAGDKLTISSAIPSGADATILVDENGIGGGVDFETDEEYLERVLAYLRNTTRNGKKGDFAAWAVDSSPEVTKAFEQTNFGIFGSLLVLVIGGNQMEGVTQVEGINAVKEYIESVAPRIPFTVATPDLKAINPSIHLLTEEDTENNRNFVLLTLKTYLQAKAEPGKTFTQELLRSVIVDGIILSDATVTLSGGVFTCTGVELPVLGAVSWI